MSHTVTSMQLAAAGVPARDVEAFQKLIGKTFEVTLPACLDLALQVDFRFFIARLVPQSRQKIAKPYMDQWHDTHTSSRAKLLAVHREHVKKCTGDRSLVDSESFALIRQHNQKTIKALHMLDVQLKRSYAHLFCLLYRGDGTCTIKTT